MTREDLIGLYRLLARSLAYPDEDYLKLVQEAVGKVRMELWDDPRLPLSALIEELGHLAWLPLEQLQGEHTRLFIAAYPRVPCPPYESVYTEGVLRGEAAEEVDGLYRQWGVVVEGEEVDHAGAELEFAAFLLALDTHDSIAAAEDLLTCHLRAWLPRFAVDLTRESRIRLYQVVGELLAAVLDESFNAGEGPARVGPERVTLSNQQSVPAERLP